MDGRPIESSSTCFEAFHSTPSRRALGWEFNYRKIRIAPEFRFTSYLDRYGIGSVQRRALLGVSFRSHPEGT